MKNNRLIALYNHLKAAQDILSELDEGDFDFDDNAQYKDFTKLECLKMELDHRMIENVMPLSNLAAALASKGS